MTSIRIPENAIGKVGMVAMLQRVADADKGKLVAVRLPVGFISTLTSSGGPTFAWQVLLLGDPMMINGKASREIVVADRCLVPVSQIEPEAVNRLAIARAEHEFDLALEDLRRILAAHPMTPEDLDQQVERAAEQFEIQQAVAVEPIPAVLQELGFRLTSRDSESTWHWSGVHAGVELYILAGQDMFGRWSLVGRMNSDHKAMWDERVVMDDEPRGGIALIVLDLWRTAFGKTAPVPAALQIAEVYARHRQDMRAINIGLPTIYADGEVFRAMRRWLARRNDRSPVEAEAASNNLLALTFDGAMLRLEIAGSAYGCPAQGAWGSDERTVHLKDFLQIPHWVLRGASIRMEASNQSLILNGWDLASSQCEFDC